MNEILSIPDQDILQELIDIFPFYVMILDSKNRIVAINKTGLKIKNLPIEKLIGKTCYEIYHNLDHPYPGCPLEKAAKNRNCQEEIFFESSLKKWIRAKVYPLPLRLMWDGTELYLHFSEDITYLKELEEEHLKTQSLDLVRLMSRGISHDIMNLLQILVLHASLAQNNDSSSEVKEHMDQILNSIQNLKEMIKELGRFSSEININKKSCQINEIVAKLVKSNIIEPTIELKLDLDHHLPIIALDEVKILEVFQNLFINAIQAISGPGKIWIKTQSIIVSTSSGLALSPGNYNLIIFQDSGCGISSENQSKLFFPLFTTKTKGNGLGLSMSNIIIKAHQGLIRVESEIGIGTKFSIYLPL